MAVPAGAGSAVILNEKQADQRGFLHFGAEDGADAVCTQKKPGLCALHTLPRATRTFTGQAKFAKNRFARFDNVGPLETIQKPDREVM